MSLWATHDEDGNISALIASPPNSPGAGMGIPPRQRSTEVEAPEVTPDFSDPAKVVERLTELRENYRVEAGADNARLVQRSE
jgi:hypothetical protein